MNLGLSKLRADTVANWLIYYGVSPKRLEIRRFALFCPLGDNTTPDGRKSNRRVEFRILKLSEEAPPQ